MDWRSGDVLDMAEFKGAKERLSAAMVVNLVLVLALIVLAIRLCDAYDEINILRYDAVSAVHSEMHAVSEITREPHSAGTAPLCPPETMSLPLTPESPSGTTGGQSF
jgi:hypothetical protein